MPTNEEVYEEIVNLLTEENTRPGGPRDNIVLRGSHVSIIRDVIPGEGKFSGDVRLHVCFGLTVANPDIFNGKSVSLATGPFILILPITRNQVLSDLVPRAQFTATFGDTPEK